MTLKTRLTFAEAASYQASFDAVEAGTATEAQAQEVAAVMAGFEHLRTIGARAGEIIDARINLLAAVPMDKRSAIGTLIDGQDAVSPRVRFDAEIGRIGTTEEIAAEKTRLAEEEAAKQAAAEAAQAESDMKAAEPA